MPEHHIDLTILTNDGMGSRSKRIHSVIVPCECRHDLSDYSTAELAQEISNRVDSLPGIRQTWDALFSIVSALNAPLGDIVVSPNEP